MNKAKEKAIELVDKFTTIIGESDFHIPEFISGIEMADESSEYKKILEDETNEVAKQGALIVCDELIAHCSQVEPWLGVNFWEEVKQEIEKL